MRFDIRGTPHEQARLTAAFAHCTYPFDLVAHDVVIPVSFRDLTADRALGLFWLSGRIEVHSKITNPVLEAEVLLSELAHAVDQYVLTDADRIRLQEQWHPDGPDEHTWFDKGPYNTWSGEAMMGLFVTAYSDLPVTFDQFVHKPTPDVVALLRSLGPVPPPPAVMFVGCRTSSVFHKKDAHWWLSCSTHTWASWEAAVAAGRRPCRWCKPSEGSPLLTPPQGSAEKVNGALGPTAGDAEPSLTSPHPGERGTFEVGHESPGHSHRVADPLD